MEIRKTKFISMVNKNKGYYHHQQIRPERKKRQTAKETGNERDQFVRIGFTLDSG